MLFATFRTLRQVHFKSAIILSIFRFPRFRGASGPMRRLPLGFTTVSIARSAPKYFKRTQVVPVAFSFYCPTGPRNFSTGVRFEGPFFKSLFYRIPSCLCHLGSRVSHLFLSRGEKKSTAPNISKRRTGFEVVAILRISIFRPPNLLKIRYLSIPII